MSVPITLQTGDSRQVIGEALRAVDDQRLLAVAVIYRDEDGTPVRVVATEEGGSIFTVAGALMDAANTVLRWNE